MAKIYTRFQQKSDTYTNWNKVPASSFIPLKGELIIYLPDSTNPNTGIKIGNGTDYIENLSFTIPTANCFDERVFIGTTEEYQTAYDNGEVAIGTLVFLTDDDNFTTAVLGKAVLGQMILG